MTTSASIDFHTLTVYPGCYVIFDCVSLFDPQDRKEMRVRRETEDPGVLWDPKEREASKVRGKTVPFIRCFHFIGPKASDLVFVVLKVTKVSKVWRAVQVIRVLKEMMEFVQIPASPARAPQDYPVCPALQDPEVFLVSQDCWGPKALRVTWVISVNLVLLVLWVRKENQGPRGSVTVQMG